MADPTEGINAEQAFAYLVAEDLPEIVVKLIDWQDELIAQGQTAMRSKLGRVLEGLLTDINRMAVEIAGLADGHIIAKIYETAAPNRPQTHDMESHIKSEPGPGGLVRVGLISELEKIVNPVGMWGTFWRAQEFGTGTDQIPTQVGRLLFGTFEPSGTPPLASEAGLGIGTDLAFAPGGRNPGLGRISVDLPGRHFLRDGAAAAGERYMQRCKEIGDKYAAEIDKLVDDAIALRREAQRTNWTAIIDA